MSSTGYNPVPPPPPVASLAGLLAVSPATRHQASQPDATITDPVPMPLAGALAALEQVFPGFTIEFEVSRAAISEAGRAEFDRAFEEVRRELAALQCRWTAASGTNETFGAYLRIACPPDVLARSDTHSASGGAQ